MALFHLPACCQETIFWRTSPLQRLASLFPFQFPNKIGISLKNPDSPFFETSVLNFGRFQVLNLRMENLLLPFVQDHLFPISNSFIFLCLVFSFPYFVYSSKYLTEAFHFFWLDRILFLNSFRLHFWEWSESEMRRSSDPQCIEWCWCSSATYSLASLFVVAICISFSALLRKTETLSQHQTLEQMLSEKPIESGETWLNLIISFTMGLLCFSSFSLNFMCSRKKEEPDNESSRQNII